MPTDFRHSGHHVDGSNTFRSLSSRVTANSHASPALAGPPFIAIWNSARSKHFDRAVMIILCNLIDQ